MSHALYLTADEAAVFNAFNERLKEGWTIESISALSEESPSELLFRLRMAKVHDNALNSIIESLLKERDIAAATRKIDFSKLSHAAMGELFFLLGVRVLSAMIRHALTDATTDEDIEGIAGLSHIRSMLSESNASTPS